MSLLWKIVTRVLNEIILKRSCVKVQFKRYYMLKNCTQNLYSNATTETRSRREERWRREEIMRQNKTKKQQMSININIHEQNYEIKTYI